MANDHGARDLRRQMRAWRRERADTTLFEQLSEAYIWVFSIVVIGAMSISAMIQTRVSIAAGCTTSTCDDARTSLIWASIGGVVATALAAAQAVGPVMVTPATGAWLLASPIDRGPLLRSRLLLASAATALGCGVLVGVIALLAGAAPAVVAVLTAGSVVAGAGATAAAAMWQVHGGRTTRWVALGVAVLTAGWMVLIALDAEPATSSDAVTSASGWIVLGVVVLLSAAVLARALTRLSSLLRAQLVPGGSLLSSLSGALAGLDLTLAYDVLVARRWLTAATVRPVRRGPAGAWALVWRDVVRLRRSPGALAAIIAALLVPYVVARLGLDDAIVLISALAAFLCGIWSFSALRTTGRNPGLVRCFPMSLAAVRTATIAVPAAVLLVWSLAAAPAIGRSLDDATAGETVLVAVATGGAALGAIVRWLLAGPPDYSQPLVSSPAGALPTGLIISTLRGFDVLALAVVPLLVAPTVNGSMVSLALSGGIISFLVSRR